MLRHSGLKSASVARPHTHRSTKVQTKKTVISHHHRGPVKTQRKLMSTEDDDEKKASKPKPKREHKENPEVAGEFVKITPILGQGWEEDPRQIYRRERTEPRESMEFDVMIVGGGPAGLSAAIRLKQLAAEKEKDISVCLIDKGAEIGSHILSGNVFQPTYLDQLIPDWRDKNAPLTVPVKSDTMFRLDASGRAIPLPIPSKLDNHGNYIISLGNLCKFLAQEAESLGVDIFPGFAAAEVLYDETNGSVRGVATGDVGIAKDGTKTSNYAQGMELLAKQTIFAEGARGSCSEEIISRFKLYDDGQHQTYGIGIKEVWELDPSKHHEGQVIHTIGFPAPDDVYCGGFIYHGERNLCYMGLVIGLDYQNPYLSPYQEMQKWKTHPMLSEMLEGGKPVGYGARALTEGGYQSVPRLSFPGGVLVGCSAGFMNVPKIKGSHNAMKSGMTAAEGIFQSWEESSWDMDKLAGSIVHQYQTKMNEGPVMAELHAARNVRPGFKFGPLGFLLNSGWELMVSKGRSPWTLKHHDKVDGLLTEPASKHRPIEYPKPDGKITFSLLDNLSRANVLHEGDQPAHLTYRRGKKLQEDKLSYAVYSGPEGRFCPAGVYEYVPIDTSKPDDRSVENTRLQINAQNCVHCKTCDIKTPNEFIKWTVPQGGEGPNYIGM